MIKMRKVFIDVTTTGLETEDMVIKVPWMEYRFNRELEIFTPGSILMDAKCIKPKKM